jgi:hypothetical protein
LAFFGDGRGSGGTIASKQSRRSLVMSSISRQSFILAMDVCALKEAVESQPLMLKTTITDTTLCFRNINNSSRQSNIHAISLISHPTKIINIISTQIVPKNVHMKIARYFISRRLGYCPLSFK